MTEHTEFTLVRDYDATPQEVWEAWTDPSEAAQWWHPRGMHTPGDTVTIDARVDGRYAYTMVDDETGERFPTGGTYREVDPPNRLAFTWGNPDDDPDVAPLITVEITAVGDGSRMSLRVERLTADMEGSVRNGWDEAMDVMGEHLAGGSS